MLIDVTLHRVMDSGKAFLGEANRFWFDGCSGEGQSG